MLYVEKKMLFGKKCIIQNNPYIKQHYFTITNLMFKNL